MGGLSKKAYQLQILRAEAGPLLALDAGNLLFKETVPFAGLAGQARVTAEGIAAAYDSMGFGAVAVGVQDLFQGVNFLRQIAASSRFPWLSANLVRQADGGPVFQSSTIVKVAGLKIGVIGLTGPIAPALLDDPSVQVLSWQQALEPVVEKLADATDLLVLLSNHPFEENRLIAEAFPAIHLILFSSPNSANTPPTQVGNTFISQSGKQGKHMGVLAIDWQASKTWGQDRMSGRLAEKRLELDGTDGRLSRYQGRLTEAELKTHQGYQELLAQRQRVAAELAALETELASLRANRQIPSSLAGRFIDLDTTMPDDPEVLRIVEETKERANNPDAARTTPPPPAGPVTEENKEPARPELAGWSACANCHIPQTRSWEQTDHAKAYLTLAAGHQNNNPECLQCHVTDRHGNFDALPGPMTEPDVDRLLALAPDLQTVGCEVCHGPGLAHAASKGEAVIRRNPGPEVCLQCHTEENDDNFDFGRDLKLAGCPVE